MRDLIDLSRPRLPIPRRSLLQALALTPAALTGTLAPRGALAAAEEAGLITGNVCLLSPEAAEGPYALDPRLVRRDIAEDRPGEALRLRLQVVRADCSPVAGARVDVWHCDAQGNRSGVGDGAGGTFLRGIQPTDAGGIAEFDTIYPGRYRGRTTHVQVKVWLDPRNVVASQIFFPEDLSDAIYQTFATYARDRPCDRTNTRDRTGSGAFAGVEPVGRRYVASLVIGIDETARSPDGRPFPGGWFH